MPRRPDRHRPVTALVFAGGGSLGAVQVGMLKALVTNGVEADLAVGASVGALNAAYFAGDPTPEGVFKLEQIWRALRRDRILPIAPLTGLLGLFAKRNHFIKPHALARLIRLHLPFRRLEEAQIPCHVVATDLFTGEEVVLSSGPVLKALLASAAIPGVLPPVRIRGHCLIDGGVANHTPLSTAVGLGAKRVIVLPTGAPCTLERMPQGILEIVLHSLNLFTVQQLLKDATYYRDQLEIIILPPLCPLSSSVYDFSVAGELIDRAANQTCAWLKQHGLSPTGIPPELAPHTHR
ncbi:MAG: patatin-like phospholipase family protein [Methylohalobius sp. ZOD2]|nr:patatin-like phospholipase family protein [Methylothermaceae bacterium]